ncbi:hypothetical protein FRC02_009205 [Tulasnella sp. 418]|nr:hypothetical protein FRC02_009205 [Tulasnella sp. 418]
MDSEAHVYLLDGRDENIGLTVRFLIDYLPSSFPIIAHLATPPLGKTRIFTSLHPSFLLENVDSSSRRLFSIGIYVEEKEGDEFPYRYYCSAEAEAPSSDGTQKELIDGHVRDFINTWFLHLELPAKGQLRIGSLNIRWLKALRSRIIYADPCAKYIRPPTPRQDTNISTSPPS